MNQDGSTTRNSALAGTGFLDVTQIWVFIRHNWFYDYMHQGLVDRVNLKGKTKFRPPSRVRNRVLYGLMLVEDIKTIEMAKLIGVSQRAVEHWIADGIMPKQARQDKLAKILKCPPHILFSEVD